MTTTVPDLAALREIASVVMKGHEMEALSASTIGLGQDAKARLVKQCEDAGFFLEGEHTSPIRKWSFQRWSRQNFRVEDEFIQVTTEDMDVPVAEGQSARYTRTVKALRLSLDPQQCRDLYEALNVLGHFYHNDLPRPLRDLHQRLTGDA